MVRLASGRGGGGLSEHRDSVQWQSHGRYPGVEYAQFREPQRTVKTNPIALEFFCTKLSTVCVHRLFRRAGRARLPSHVWICPSEHRVWTRTSTRFAGSNYLVPNPSLCPV